MTTNMKTSFLTMTFLFLAALSFQYSSAKACDTCSEINKLRQMAMQVKNINLEEEQAKAKKVISGTVSLIEAHDQKSKKQNDIEEFQRLVVLVSDALPLDPVVSVVESLLEKMKSPGGGQRLETYRKSLPLIKNSCKRKFLEVVMKELSCVMKTGSGDDGSEKPSCVAQPVFKYESCMKELTKRSQKKSSNPKGK